MPGRGGGGEEGTCPSSWSFGKQIALTYSNARLRRDCVNALRLSCSTIFPARKTRDASRKPALRFDADSKLSQHFHRRGRRDALSRARGTGGRLPRDKGAADARVNKTKKRRTANETIVIDRRRSASANKSAARRWWWPLIGSTRTLI